MNSSKLIRMQHDDGWVRAARVGSFEEESPGLSVHNKLLGIRRAVDRPDGKSRERKGLNCSAHDLVFLGTRVAHDRVFAGLLAM